MLRLRLLDTHSQKPQQEWIFGEEHSLVRVGRNRDQEVSLPGYGLVSRCHLRLERSPTQREQWQLTSQGINGTFHQGQLIKTLQICDRDRVQLAADGPWLDIEIFQAPAFNGCHHNQSDPNNLFCVHCGEPMVEQEEFIRHYQIMKTLGVGGMGTTYIAWDRQGKTMGKPSLLVLKEMNAEMIGNPKAEELFQREATTLQNLSHPGIPPYHDFFVEGDKKYLAMGLIHGITLETWVHKKGPVGPAQAIAWMVQTCEVLHYLHSLNPPLIHRDIKPANLMLRTLDQRIMVLDFGAVKQIGTPKGTRIGSEGYSAPEQTNGKPCIESDLFSIAATIIFLVTGESPMQYYQLHGGGVEFCLDRIPTIAPALGQVLQKASASHIKARYHSAQELAIALKRCL